MFHLSSFTQRFREANLILLFSCVFVGLLSSSIIADEMSAKPEPLESLEGFVMVANRTGSPSATIAHEKGERVIQQRVRHYLARDIPAGTTLRFAYVNCGIGDTAAIAPGFSDRYIRHSIVLPDGQILLPQWKGAGQAGRTVNERLVPPAVAHMELGQVKLNAAFADYTLPIDLKRNQFILSLQRDEFESEPPINRIGAADIYLGAKDERAEYGDTTLPDRTLTNVGWPAKPQNVVPTGSAGGRYCRYALPVIAILARVKVEDERSFVFMGDSNSSSGATDGSYITTEERGWIQHGLGLSTGDIIASANFGNSGRVMRDFASLQPNRIPNRNLAVRLINDICRPTDVLFALGTNDAITPGRSISTPANVSARFGDGLMRKLIRSQTRILCSTIPPITNIKNDAPLILAAGEPPKGPTTWEWRREFNELIREGIAGVDGIIDITRLIEQPENPDLYRPEYLGVGDGVHYKGAAHAPAGVALRAAISDGWPIKGGIKR